MDFDGLVTEHSFTYPEQNYSHEASVLIEDDFFVGDVVEIFSSPKRTSPSRSINRASEHPDLDPEMLRIVEEVIMAAESWRNMDKDITFGIMDPSRDSNSSSASGVDDYDDDIEIEEKEMESNATTKSNVVFEEPLKEV